MNTETTENYKLHVLLSSIYFYLGKRFFFLINYYWLFFSASKWYFYVDADGGGTYYYYYRVSRHNWYLSKTGPKLYGCKRRGN